MHAKAQSSSAPPASLINTYSTRNLGDAAILRATARLLPGGKAQAIINDRTPLTVPGVSQVAALPEDRLRVSVGGDIFNNGRPFLVTRNFVDNVRTLALRPGQTISFGQTIPASCRGIGFRLLARALRGVAAVVVRDRESQALLKRRGIDARLSWDIAFTTETSLSAQKRAAAILDIHRLRPDRTVLVSVRPFDALYPGNQAAFETEVATLATRLNARGHDVALLIQSDVAHWDTDRLAAARIHALTPSARIVDCLSDPYDPDPVATLTALLGLANIVIGVRYHTSVLRLAAGRQPFNLYYSRKGADLHRRLGLPGARAGAGDINAAIAAIEHSADLGFDPAPLRQDVVQHFADAVRRAA